MRSQSKPRELSESDSADELIVEQEAGGSDHNEADEDEDEMVDEEADEDEDEMFLSRHMVGHITGSAGWKRKMMIFFQENDYFGGCGENAKAVKTENIDFPQGNECFWAATWWAT